MFQYVFFLIKKIASSDQEKTENLNFAYGKVRFKKMHLCARRSFTPSQRGLSIDYVFIWINILKVIKLNQLFINIFIVVSSNNINKKIGLVQQKNVNGYFKYKFLQPTYKFLTCDILLLPIATKTEYFPGCKGKRNGVKERLISSEVKILLCFSIKKTRTKVILKNVSQGYYFSRFLEITKAFHKI